MRDLEIRLFSVPVRTMLFVVAGVFLFGGAATAVSLGAPDSFESTRGRYAAKSAPRQDPGTVAEGHDGSQALSRPALTITKVVRRGQTFEEEERHGPKGRMAAAPCVTALRRDVRWQQSVLAANAADITRLCRYLL